MKIEIYCSLCGHEKRTQFKRDAVNKNTTLGDLLEEAGWIVQQNGNNLDIYCSETCAR